MACVRWRAANGHGEQRQPATNARNNVRFWESPLVKSSREVGAGKDHLSTSYTIPIVHNQTSHHNTPPVTALPSFFLHQIVKKLRGNGH